MSYEKLYKECSDLSQSCMEYDDTRVDSKTKQILDDFAYLCSIYVLTALYSRDFDMDLENEITKKKNDILKHVNFKKNPSYYEFLHCYDACMACGRVLRKTQERRNRRKQWIWVKKN